MLSMDERTIAKKRIALLRKASKILKGLAVKPMPKNLTKAQKEESKAYSEWLRDAS